MSKDEAAKLHTLFLSKDKNNWNLAAAIATKADFEQVMELEVERLRQVDNIEMQMNNHSIVSEYDDWFMGISTESTTPLMLGGKLGLTTELCEHWFKLCRIWKTKSHNLQTYAACYFPEDDSLTFGGPKVKQPPYFNCTSILGHAHDTKGGCVNEYLQEDFELEIEVVKKVWRKQFLNLKNNLL